VWESREKLTAYDAAYVALAEALGCGPLTANRGLSRGAAARCAVTIVSD
jgi:predicted nucleic acid-binding protein